MKSVRFLCLCLYIDFSICKYAIFKNFILVSYILKILILFMYVCMCLYEGAHGGIAFCGATGLPAGMLGSTH